MLKLVISFCFFSALALTADTNAFVSQLWRASTISFLSAPSGEQTRGVPLLINTYAGAAYSPDGKTAAVVDFASDAQHQYPPALAIYDLVSGKSKGRFSLTVDAIVSIVFTADGSKLFFSAESNQSTVYELDIATLALTEVYSTSQPAVLALSADGSTLFLGTGSVLRLLSATTFQQEAAYPIGAPITGFGVAPDGKRLYVAAEFPLPEGNAIVAFNLQTGKQVGHFPGNYAVVSPDSSTVYAAATAAQQITLEQVSAATLAVLKSASVGPVFSNALFTGMPLAISPDGSTLAVIDQPLAPSVTFLSAASLSIGTVTPVGNACGVQFTSASQLAVTNCGANTVEVVDVTTKHAKAEFDAGPSPENTLVHAGVLYVSNPYGVWALSVSTGKVLNKIVVPNAAPAQYGNQLALSADGSTLFASNLNGVAEIATATNQLRGLVPGIPAGVTVGAIATSPDGKLLFAAVANFNDYSLLLLNQQTGTLVKSVPAGSLGYELVASKDSASLYYEGIFHEAIVSLTVFDVASETFSGSLPAGGGMVLSPDGKTLYVAQGYGTGESAVAAIDTATLTSVLLQSPVPPGNVGITPDGSELVVTSTTSFLGLIGTASPNPTSVIYAGAATQGICVR